LGAVCERRKASVILNVVRGIVAVAFGLAVCSAAAPRTQAIAARSTATLTVRGHPQTLQIYGQPGSGVAVVSSGDGGWVHLAPHVADVLAAQGWYVVGFDAKAYLSSFTDGKRALSETDVPNDYAQLVDFAARGARSRPVLIGVSEGAGLSVLAATTDAVKRRIDGVVGLGLPDVSELGWRWRDVIIYVTHKPPNEPSFSAADVIARVAPLPLAAIHSTSDEFVPVPEVQRVLARASEPKKLWLINAADHRFSNNQAEFDARLVDALAWVRQNAPKGR
jgi:fermentation-respiration switch protein FrsA (DUF1100 family)